MKSIVGLRVTAKVMAKANTQNSGSLSRTDKNYFLTTVGRSVTRWLDYSYNFWPFTTINFCPIA